MYSKQLIIITFIKSLALASSGILNVGFDIDDTILFSRDVFLNIPKNLTKIWGAKMVIIYYCYFLN